MQCKPRYDFEKILFFTNNKMYRWVVGLFGGRPVPPVECDEVGETESTD